MTKLISLYAGEKAYAQIRANGLRPDDISVVAGAAGGPKWLILRHLDHILFGSWLARRQRPLFLVGSSIGAWRFAAASQKDPVAALERFQAAYLEQSYDVNPSPEAISRELERILDRLMGDAGAHEILSHPFMRLNIMAVRCKGPTGSDVKPRLMSGLAMAAVGNVMIRRALGLFFERTLFHDPREQPPFFNMKGFPLQQVALTEQNIKPALIASGSIPLLMPGVVNIPGAPEGAYRDGGIIDYHMNIPFTEEDEGIVLFPHYAESIVPGWLDKQLPWRRPELSNMVRVLMIAPSGKALEQLPHQKVADRKDFYRYSGRDQERIAYWYQVLDMSRQMAEEFMSLVETGKLGEHLRPLSDLYPAKKNS